MDNAGLDIVGVVAQWLLLLEPGKIGAFGDRPAQLGQLLFLQLL